MNSEAPFATPPDPVEEAIFNAASELADPQSRAAFLDRACGDDAALRGRLEALLQAHHRAKRFFAGEPLALTQPVESRATPAISPPEQAPSDRIGRYKLLEKIGEGGCGVVYMAEQKEPVRRRVALKIIKLGMDSRQVIARFEAERQALALMDHPNIAKVFDGGVTGTDSAESQISNLKSEISKGRPYFVMELVRGIKITQYCDENNLSTQQRLNLFIQVCQAVQHAHQKGIIHRDLKPSNILVTENDGVPVPKVIDFGIAKATEQKLTDKTLFTQFAAFIGTPAYMSPEQAALTSVDIDTRSDIYSLGVLLYELLTGTTPFDTQELLKAGFDEIRRVIRETEPEKPSTRLTQARSQASAVAPGNSALRTPHSALDRDLDWIVMKCLDKDRSRRYATANGLAADLQRHLNNEPVVARPPSAAYRFQKMVRRNRVAFSAATVVLAALICGLSVAVWQFVERNRAYRRAVTAEQLQSRLRQQAETEAIKSRQVAKFLQDMLRGVRPSVAQGRDSTMLREILDRTAGRIGRELKSQPEVQAQVLSTLAHSYEEIGLKDEARRHYREVVRLLESVHGRDHPAVAGALVDLSSVLNHRTEAEESEALNREALAIYRRHLGSNNLAAVPALINIGLAHGRRDAAASEEAFYREAISLYERNPGHDDADLAYALYKLAECRYNERAYAEARRLAERALTIYRTAPEKHAAELADAVELVGLASYRQRDYVRAEQCFREHLAGSRQRFGDRDKRTLEPMSWLALTLAATPAREEGIALVREMMAIEREVWTNNPEKLSVALAGDADLLSKFGQFAEAEPLFRQRVERLRPLVPADDDTLLRANASLARCLSECVWAEHTNSKLRTPNSGLSARAREAERLLRDGLALRLRGTNATHWRTDDVRSRLGFALVATAVIDPALNPDARAAKLVEAEPLLHQSHLALLENKQAEFRYKGDALSRLVRLYEAWDELAPNTGKAEKAAEWRGTLAQTEISLAAEEKPSGADP